jgi:hypothetical protein
VLKILSLVLMLMMLQPLCCVVVDVDDTQPLCCVVVDVDDAPAFVL